MPDPPGSAEEGQSGELLQEGLSAQPSCPKSSQPGDSCLRAFFLAAGWACGIVVPQPGIERVPPTLQARRLSCWTTGEVSLRGFPWTRGPWIAVQVSGKPAGFAQKAQIRDLGSAMAPRKGEVGSASSGKSWKPCNSRAGLLPVLPEPSGTWSVVG